MKRPARALALLSTLVLTAGCETTMASGGDAGPAGPDAARGDAPGVLGDAPGFTGDAPGTDAPSTATDAPSAATDAPVAIAGTAGCGMATTDATATWVEHTITVAAATRTYFVYLPTGYDPARVYPIVYQFHGCSGSATRETNTVPVQRESGADAIHVRGRALADCWDTGATGVDVPFIDAMMAEVEATFCADPGRRFATGYSSGGFMTHRLACIRGALFRGVATIAGGQGGSGCTGSVAALLIHDDTDTTVNISASVGARDAHVTRNTCEAATPSVPWTEYPPCQTYVGCDPRLPVVWCQTTGMNHARQDTLSAPAFWAFLSSLPR